MAWTEERVELLKKLWRDGLSASQIAAELGDVNRNAVIGKVHRLGLSGRTKPRSAATTSNRKPIGRVRKPSISGHPAVDIQYVEYEAPANDLEIPAEQRKTILQLTNKCCHWPVGTPGTPEFFFCGAPVREGASYCGYHCHIAYVPRIPRANRPAPTHFRNFQR